MNSVNLLIPEVPLAQDSTSWKQNLHSGLPKRVQSLRFGLVCRGRSVFTWSSSLVESKCSCPGITAGERGNDPPLRDWGGFRMICWHQILIPFVPFKDFRTKVYFSFTLAKHTVYFCCHKTYLALKCKRLEFLKREQRGNVLYSFFSTTNAANWLSSWLKHGKLLLEAQNCIQT